MDKKHILVALAVFAACCAPADAQVLDPPPEAPQTDGNGVNLQTLTPSYSRSVVSIGPKGAGGLDYSIKYVGDGTRDNQYTLVAGHFDSGGTPTATLQVGGFSESFPSGLSSPSLGDGSSLISLGAAWAWTQKDGTVTNFSQLVIDGSDGMGGSNEYDMANTITHLDGNVTTYHYASYVVFPGLYRVRIQSITTNMGYQLKYNYANNTPGNADWLTQTSVVAINNAVEYCDPNADTCSVSPSWPQAQYLTGAYGGGVRDANASITGGSATYISLTAPTLPPNSTRHLYIQTPDHASPNYDYTLTFQPSGFFYDMYVTTSATIDGKTTNYTNTGTGSLPLNVTSSGPLSQQYTYTSDGFGFGVTKAVDPVGRTTNYTYGSPGQVTSAMPPEGNTTNIAYDANGNTTQITQHPKPGSGSTPLIESWTYGFMGCSPAACNEPVTHTDPRGQVTSFTYNSTTGQVLTETDPPDANGINPVKRYSYSAHTALIQNSTNTAFVAAGPPISLLDSMKTCRTTATVSGACAGGTSDEIETDYDYGPTSGAGNNLLLRGTVVVSNGTSLRTCYGYDNYGNKISETKPNAGLTSCP